MTNKSDRGRFRSVDFELVKKLANDPMFYESESNLIYQYPIKLEEVDLDRSKESAIGIPEDQLIRVGPFLTATSPESHIGPFKSAIDFLCADGTPIYAAQSGKIIEVAQENDIWGDGQEFAGYLNFITIEHDGGLEYSQYCHLAKDSVRAQVQKDDPSNVKWHDGHITKGSYVIAGQQIGVVGKTGWTDRDHLHFIVFESTHNPFGFKSSIPKWK